MRLRFFSGGSYVSGMEIVLLDLFRQLIASGHQPFALVSGWNDGDFPSRLSAAKVPYHELRLGRFYMREPLWTIGTIRHLPVAAVQFREILNSIKPHAIIHSDIRASLAPILLSPNQSHILYLHTAPDPMLNRIWVRLARAKIKGIICVSEFVENLTRKLLDYPLPTCVCHNGISISSISSPPTRVNNAIVRFGIIGQLLPKKRVELAFAAFKRLPLEDQTRSELHVYGARSKDQRQYLDILSHSTGAPNKVRVFDFVPDRASIYLNLDVVLTPAVEEGFGMTAAEAGLFGLPVIAAKSGGLLEVVVENESGLLFEPDNAEAMAACMSRLINDPQLRTRLGNGGRKRVEQHFDIVKSASRFVSCLESLMGIQGQI